MNVEELFKGIAVIFDDEITNPKATIFRIKEYIQKKNIPVAVYEKMPKKDIIPSLSKASFVILDWDYNAKTLHSNDGDRVIVSDSLKEEQEKDLIAFIKELLDRIFVPIFIFTSFSVDNIKGQLCEASLWHDDKINRIFIKQKNEINTEEQLFDAIEEWVKNMPSVYVLKEWEKVVSKNKDEMFLELYKYSPNWVKIIWDMLKEDSKENEYEFGKFITRILINRISMYKFDENIINMDKNVSSDELKHVIEGERYLVYSDAHKLEQAYTGDLFEGENGKYYLNIGAQCDLSRSKGGEYNPELFCIVGEKLRKKSIMTGDLRLTSEGKITFPDGKSVELKKLQETCSNEKELCEFNKQLRKYTKDNVFFEKGTFIERSNNVIIGCIAEQDAFRFNLKICVKKFSEIKDKRIGRILPPYITRIQQKCSQYMIREGVLPVPKELFTDVIDIIKNKI